jgi:hypothetical protein
MTGMDSEGREREVAASFGELFRKNVLDRGSGLGLLLARLVGAYTWYWGWTGKTPWNGWGWLPGYLKDEATYTQFPQYRSFLQTMVLPNINGFGWMQFVIEFTLSITLASGFLTGLTGLLAVVWAATVVFGSYPVPGELSFNLLNLFIVPVVIWSTRAGRFMGVDAFLRPRLLASQSKVLRLIGRICT